MTTLPYVIGIHLKQSSGANRANTQVKITNVRTNETITATTGSDGKTIIDLGNLEDGYIVGEKLKVEKVISDTDMEYYITNNGDEANPSWFEFTNETRTRIYPNSTRFKLNTDRYGGGMGPLKFTLN